MWAPCRLACATAASSSAARPLLFDDGGASLPRIRGSHRVRSPGRRRRPSRELDGGVRIESDLEARKLYGVYIVALIGFSISLVVITLALGLAIGIGAVVVDGSGIDLDGAAESMMAGEAFSYGVLGLFLAIYLLMFAIFSALNHIFLVQPTLSLYSRSITVLGLDKLERARQRAGVDMAEAEGFADALDVGAAF